ncbi:putative glutamine amidotransferase [Sphaerochaeta associata]|uniref:Gamma-glutamyl-gamma-aminobutyrate hydrolase family protein n=1 Tax=Sphaerochaeta associata TaxID=1129264 RepID=A0ABY4DA36_9SPIR|nr:gamma-glutamyl-gamma-aminobutyrate hydrolase family protein [Sphaerochaeta associata]UOM51143.1 gamma-glutamyl-gamma-aminobutyrate hydrolase family protein [Sphaerochaeta associata]SMP50001.1 putative glutamine amidotransferase [Sphaerochaeta associata]
MSKPVIGLGGVLEKAPPTSAFPSFRRLFTNEGYLSKLQKAGALPILLPMVPPTDLELLVSLCDGILLPGGPDVDPSLYNQERHELCGPSDMDVDRYQIQLFRMARKLNKPILGICRGTQLINVAQGGTLFQDYRLQSEKPIAHPDYERWGSKSHQVELSPQSKLYKLFKTHTLGVNSLHHQSVAKPGEHCIVTARSADDSIEAIELSSGAWCIGVQWHPEAMGSEMDCLFEAFIKQALSQGKSGFPRTP